MQRLQALLPVKGAREHVEVPYGSHLAHAAPHRHAIVQQGCERNPNEPACLDWAAHLRHDTVRDCESASLGRRSVSAAWRSRLAGHPLHFAGGYYNLRVER